jgi:hypothetical protein
LRLRAATGKDASEADLPVLEYQISNLEPLNASERRAAIAVNTDSEVGIESVVAAIRKVATVA